MRGARRGPRRRDCPQDLKPANLFLARRSDGSVRVKLLDFGISKVTTAPGAASEGGMTSTQALMGSPLYMAPEQMRSSKGVDARADIWSMGVILYEMLGGRSPFNGDTLPQVCARIMAEPPDPLRDIRRGVSPALEAVVMRCLEKDAQRRFQDVAALAQALAPFGQADARGAAERIGRVMRGKQPSSVDIRAGAAATTAVSTAHLEIAQTAAAFGTAAPAPTVGRPGRLPLVAVAGAVAVAGVVAVFAFRGTPAQPRQAAAAVVAAPPPVAAPPVAAPVIPLATEPGAAAALARCGHGQHPDRAGCQHRAGRRERPDRAGRDPSGVDRAGRRPHARAREAQARRRRRHREARGHECVRRA